MDAGIVNPVLAALSRLEKLISTNKKKQRASILKKKKKANAFDWQSIE
jgi:hypothetical protein